MQIDFSPRPNLDFGSSSNGFYGRCRTEKAPLIRLDCICDEAGGLGLVVDS